MPWWRPSRRTAPVARNLSPASQETAMADRRELHANEAKFVRHVFRDSISIENTEIVRRSWLFGGFTPYGSIRMGDGAFSTDYIGPDMYHPPGAPTFKKAHLFLHELGHSWQHFTGAPMLLRFSQAQRQGRRVMKEKHLADTAVNTTAAVYAYAITPDKRDLLDYNMEQQCEIIADYFSHVMWGRALKVEEWNDLGQLPPTRPQLEGVLRRFVEDPRYPMDGRWLWRARGAVRGAER
jgi:hypothetical protein